MRLLHRDAAEAPLKQMAGAARSGVDEGGVAPALLADRAREPVDRLRRQDEMDVVGRQAIGPAGDAVGLASLGEKIAIERVVAGLGERLPPAGAAQGDVMGTSGMTMRDRRAIGAGQGSRRDRAMSPSVMSP
jgi:hypothetical protein